MGKGLIIGLAGLGIGLAVAGGVGGYFIADAQNKEIPKNNEMTTETTVEEEVAFCDYNFPEEFNYVSHSVYDIGENFALFSSSSVGSYLLNKETKDFTFFNSSYVSTYSKEINGSVYFWLANNNLFKFDVKQGNYEVVALNSGVAFSNLSFIGYSGNTLLLKGYSSLSSSSTYHLVAFDTEKGQSQVFDITNTQYNYADVCLDLGETYYLTRIYDISTSSSSVCSSYLFNKESKDCITISDYYLYGKSLYKVKGTKMYAVLRNSTTNFLCSIDTTDGTMTVLQTSFSGNGKFFDCENGTIYSYQRELGNSGYYSSIYAYYISFEDDSVTKIGYEDESPYCCTYVINDKLVFSPQTTTTNKYGRLALFNEETKQLETIFTALVSSSNSSSCTIYEFNGKYYVSSDNSNFAVMEVTESGNFIFKKINLKCSLNATKYDLGENRYVFASEGIKFYDFDNDIYKSLTSSSISVVDLTVEDNIVIIYASNNVKYEFNLTTLSFKAVAYWQ